MVQDRSRGGGPAQAGWFLHVSCTRERLHGRLAGGHPRLIGSTQAGTVQRCVRQDLHLLHRPGAHGLVPRCSGSWTSPPQRPCEYDGRLLVAGMTRLGKESGSAHARTGRTGHSSKRGSTQPWSGTGCSGGQSVGSGRHRSRAEPVPDSDRRTTSHTEQWGRQSLLPDRPRRH